MFIVQATARVCVPDKPSQASLIVVGEAGAYPSEVKF